MFYLKKSRISFSWYDFLWDNSCEVFPVVTSRIKPSSSSILYAVYYCSRCRYNIYGTL